MGGDQFVVLGPEHAAVIAGSGFSLTDVQQYLFEHARVPVERIGAKKLDEAATWASTASGSRRSAGASRSPTLPRTSGSSSRAG